jgi:cytochrome c oxidase cbb3-type subunit 2
LNDWRKLPPTLPELRTSAAGQPQSRLAQIAKFGMPGTDMPGHEYLSDGHLASVALWLKSSAPQNVSQPQAITTGDHE